MPPRDRDFRPAGSLLLLRNARRLAHRVPALKLARHVLAERLRGRAAHDHAGGGQALLYRLLLEAFVDGRVELGDDRSRRVARRDQPAATIATVAISCFQQGRGECRSPRDAANPKNKKTGAYDFDRYRDDGDEGRGAQLRSKQLKCREHAVTDHRDDK